MYKLNGHGLTRGVWFRPETQPLTLTERESSCSITLGPDAPGIGFNDWILQEDGPEGPIVWRVKGINDSKDTETVTVELEHVIRCLDDPKLFVEATTKVLAGNSSATTVTAQKAAQYILSLQSDWTLGDFEYNVSNPYEFSGDSLLDALETISDSLEDCVWEYDMTQYPFVLHFRQRDTDVRCEMRGGRNLSTFRQSISRSGMYTRLYPIGQNNLHINGDYVSQNEATYGRIDHIETDQTITTKANLQTWAQGLLRRHCEPAVTITVSGLELSEDTGEDLDKLLLNKLCRVPLPKYGTTITERIVKKAWRDLIADRQSVTITLANNSADVTKIIRNQSRKSGKAAKGNAKQNYLFEANEEHLYYEVFDESGYLHGRLEMTEQQLQINFDNLFESARSELMMTAESLRVTFESDIESTRSEITQTADMISLIVEPIYGEDASGNPVITDYGIIPAKIEASVGKDGSTVKIDANHIRIGGSSSNVTLADAIEIKNINGVSSVVIKKQLGMDGNDIVAWGGNITAANNGTRGGDVTGVNIKVGSSGSLVFNGSQNQSPVSLTRADAMGLLDSYSHVALVGPNNNEYELWYMPVSTALTLNNSTPSVANGWIKVGTFSRAASQSTTIMGTWGSGIYTVSSTPAGSGGVSPPISTTIGFDSDWATWNGAELSMPIRYEHPTSGVWTATGLVAKYTVPGLEAANIKSGVTIGGVQGSYTGASYKSGWEDCYETLLDLSTPSCALGYGETANALVKLTDKDGTAQTVVNRTYTGKFRWFFAADSTDVSYATQQGHYYPNVGAGTYKIASSESDHQPVGVWVIGGASHSITMELKGPYAAYANMVAQSWASGVTFQQATDPVDGVYGALADCNGTKKCLYFKVESGATHAPSATKPQGPFSTINVLKTEMGYSTVYECQGSASTGSYYAIIASCGTSNRCYYYRA